MSGIKGKIVAEAIFKDVEGFYYHAAKFSIKKEFNSKSRHHVSLRGSGEQSRVALSKDFCEFDITSIGDLLSALIVISHEIAHYLNRHNDRQDRKEIDFTAIETWADFFGARIFMTAITFGKKSQYLIKRFIEVMHQDSVLPAVGRAIGDIYEKIYKHNTDARYPQAFERVLIFNAGTTSFFYRLFGEINPSWTIHVITTLLREAGFAERAGQHNPNWAEHDEIVKTASFIHREIQGDKASITHGLKPQYIPLLTTNYQITPDQEKSYRKKWMTEIEKIGLNPADILKVKE